MTHPAIPITTVLQRLAQYLPGSAGSAEAILEQTLLAAEQSFPLLHELALEVQGKNRVQIVPVEAFLDNEQARQDSETLGQLFKHYGSDKATAHNYHLLYGSLLGKIRNEPVRMLEIGLGTNNTDVVSNMGVEGKPGASLRAFRDFLPNGQIFGADIDTRILFTEERIRTFPVDQTKAEAFEKLGASLGPEPLDLFIDDGLHAPNANIASLTFGLKHLKPGGWALIEDIPPWHLPVWFTVSAIMPETHKTYIVKTSTAYIVAVRKPA